MKADESVFWLACFFICDIHTMLCVSQTM